MADAIVDLSTLPASARAASGVPVVYPVYLGDSHASARAASGVNPVRIEGTHGNDFQYEVIDGNSLTVIARGGQNPFNGHYYTQPKGLYQFANYSKFNLTNVWMVDITNLDEDPTEWTSLSTISFSPSGATGYFLSHNGTNEARFVADYRNNGVSPAIGDTATKVGGATPPSFEITGIQYFGGERVIVECTRYKNFYGNPWERGGSGVIDFIGNSSYDTKEHPYFQFIHDTGRYLVIRGWDGDKKSSNTGKLTSQRYVCGGTTLRFSHWVKLEIYDMQFQVRVPRDTQPGFYWNASSCIDLYPGDYIDSDPTADIRIWNNVIDATNITSDNSNFNSVIKDNSTTFNSTATEIRVWNNTVFHREESTGNMGLTKLNNTCTIFAYNNTVNGAGHGFYFGNDSVPSTNHSLYIKNNSVTKNSTGNPAIYGAYLYGTKTTVQEATNNLSSDATAPGTFAIHSGVVKYISTTDLHLHRDDITARYNGADLSQDAWLPFNTDIDGNRRGVYGAWDIGSDQSLAIPTYRHPDYTDYEALGDSATGIVTLVDLNLAGYTFSFSTQDVIVPDGNNERLYLGYVTVAGDVTESLRLGIGVLNASVGSTTISLSPEARLRDFIGITPIHSGTVTIRKWSPDIDILNTFVVMRGILRNFKVDSDGTESFTVENWERNVNADVQQVEINAELWGTVSGEAYTFPYPVLYGKVNKTVLPQVAVGSTPGGINTAHRYMIAGHEVGTTGGFQFVSDNVYTGTTGASYVESTTVDSFDNTYAYIDTKNVGFNGKTCVVDTYGKRDNEFGRATEQANAQIKHPAEIAVDVICDYAGYVYPEEVDTDAFRFLRDSRIDYKFGAALYSQVTVKNFVDDILSQCLAFGYTKAGLFRIFPFDIDGPSREHLIEDSNIVKLDFEEGDPNLVCNEIKLMFDPRHDSSSGYRQKILATYSDRHGGFWLNSRCAEAKRLYGDKETIILGYDYVNDANTAGMILQELIKIFTKMRIMTTITATYDASRIRIGDVFSVTHSLGDWDKKRFIALSTTYGTTQVKLRGMEV